MRAYKIIGIMDGSEVTKTYFNNQEQDPDKLLNYFSSVEGKDELKKIFETEKEVIIVKLLQDPNVG